MSSLARIQAQFHRQLLQGDSNVLTHIQSGGQITPAQRVSIYETGYFARLTEVLATDYKVLWMVLGDEEFSVLAKAYIIAKPSRYFSLRWFGQDFAQFLSEQEGEHANMLAQLARLEWAFVDAFNSADVTMLALEKIASVTPENWPTLRFKFHPSLQVVTHDWNVLSFWRAGREEQPFPELEHSQNSQKMLVWRKALTTQYRTLSIDEACALSAAVDGLNFSEICQVLVEQQMPDAELASIVIGWLQNWLAEGLICDIE
ncbi:MAG: DNA-binding domain-containing protein [Oceanospirillaceae bacterium]